MDEAAFDFGDRLRQLRVAKGLKQVQVAKRIGVSRSIISAYENNTKTPSYVIVTRFALLYGVSTDYLVGLQPKRSIFVDGLSEEQISAVQALVDSIRNAK